jgi:parallel beta-helix repeat protein
MNIIIFTVLIYGISGIYGQSSSPQPIIRNSPIPNPNITIPIPSPITNPNITNPNITIPSSPAPPVIIYPILYDQLSPKTSITIGYSQSADVIVDQNIPDSFYNATQEVLNYLTFIEQTNGNLSPKTIMIESGTYTTSIQITIDSNNTEIKGVSSTDTIIQLASNSPSWLNTNTSRSPGLIRTKFTSNLYFHDFTLDGNQVNQPSGGLFSLSKSGLYLHACTNVMISNIAIINFPESGLVIHEDTITNTQSSNISTMNSKMDNNYLNGIEFAGVLTSSIEGNTISNNYGGIGQKGGGILITQGSQYIIITNNNYTNNNYGIVTNLHLAKQVGFITIENNNINNSTQAGIYASNSTNIYFEHNLVDISRTCWKLNTIANSIFANNTCNDILLWSGKKNTTGFDKCVNCVNTTIETNRLTSDATTLTMSLTMFAMGISGAILIYLL